MFGSVFLNLKTIGLTLNFTTVGEEEVKNLVMIERYYLDEKPIREYEFKFGFCIPKSQNSTEFIYDLPQFSED